MFCLAKIDITVTGEVVSLMFRITCLDHDLWSLCSKTSIVVHIIKHGRWECVKENLLV